jgi:hypothetical protein
MALTSADSLSRVNAHRKPRDIETETDNDNDVNSTTDPDHAKSGVTSGPRRAFTRTSRPISVDEDAKRMISLRAERVLE